MKLLFRLLLSGLLLSPLFASAGRIGRALQRVNNAFNIRGKTDVNPTNEKAFGVRLKDSFCSASCRESAQRVLSLEAVDFLNQVPADNPAAIALIEKAEEIYNNLSLSGENNPGLHLLALANAIKDSKDYPSANKNNLARHIKSLAKKISKSTSERQERYVGFYLDHYRKDSRSALVMVGTSRSALAMRRASKSELSSRSGSDLAPSSRSDDWLERSEREEADEAHKKAHSIRLKDSFCSASCRENANYYLSSEAIEYLNTTPDDNPVPAYLIEFVPEIRLNLEVKGRNPIEDLTALAFMISLESSQNNEIQQELTGYINRILRTGVDKAVAEKLDEYLDKYRNIKMTSTLLPASTRDADKASDVHLSNVFCSASCRAVADRLLSNEAKSRLDINIVLPTDTAAIALIENVEKISESLEANGKNVEENLNALAYKISLERWGESDEEAQMDLANHIKNLAEGMSEVTEEKQEKYVDAYRRLKKNHKKE